MQWQGTIIRDEGIIDRTSRSAYLIAKMDSDESNKYLSPGLFVKASITGRELQDIFSIPRKALYGKDRVYVIDDDNLLNFRTVTVVRTESDRVLISDGLESGERVCITNLAAAIDRMKVRIKIEDEDPGPEDSGPAKADADEDAQPEA